MNFPAFHSSVAYLKHIVQIYSYHGGNDLRNHLSSYFQQISMGKLRLGYMIIWVQELTRMLQANLVRQWLTVLTGQGYSHVGLVKKGNHTLLNRMKNRFLATADEFQIKFWYMDDVNIFTTTALEGGLPSSPCIQFNKEGILLAISTRENGIKMVANADGLQLLRSIENHAVDTSR
uniref:Uncharacterized protein n=1 Tax=Quercus lobata TaxID=97700 RepID=A0A7N2R5R4_QUELO